MKRLALALLFSCLLFAALPARASEFGKYEPPHYDDVLRLKDILFMADNIEKFYKKTGHYPLASDPQLEMNTIAISSYGVKDGPLLPWQRLDQELTRVLGADAKLHLDPSDGVEGMERRIYRYASDGQDYYISTVLNTEAFYSRKLDDDHFLVELSSRPSKPDKQYSRLQLLHYLKSGEDDLDVQIGLAGALASKNFADAKAAIDNGANVNPPCEFQTRCFPLADAAQKGDLETVKFLLDNGADINGFTAFYDVPLTSALANKQTEVVKFLLDKGAMVNAPNAYGITPFIGALAAGDVEMVKLMMDKGANVNRRFIAANSETKPGETGERPLEAAIHSGKPELVEMLLKAGADATLTGLANATMLDMAEGMDNKKITDLVKAAAKK